MLDDANYYARREADEEIAFARSKDPRVRNAHALMASKYRQLAERASVERAEK